MDLLLGVLAACGNLVYEKAAQELSIPLTGTSAVIEADYDPRASGMARPARTSRPCV